MKKIFFIPFITYSFFTFCQEVNIDEQIKIKNEVISTASNFILGLETKPMPGIFWENVGLKQSDNFKDFKFRDIQKVYFINSNSDIQKINKISELEKFFSGYNVFFQNNKKKSIVAFIDNFSSSESVNGLKIRQVRELGKGYIFEVDTSVNIDLEPCEKYSLIPTVYLNDNPNCPICTWLKNIEYPGIYIETINFTRLNQIYLQFSKDLWISKDEIIKVQKSGNISNLKLFKTDEIITLINIELTYKK